MALSEELLGEARALLPDVVALKEPEAFTDLLLSAAPSADEADSPLRSLTHAFRARAVVGRGTRGPAIARFGQVCGG